MIIWGSKGRIRTIGNGQFNCPQCQRRAPYTHKKAQKWFTLYFIPLFPMQTYGEFVACDGCKGEYKSEILSYDPEAERAAYLARMESRWTSALFTVAGAFGPLAPEQSAAIMRHGLSQSSDTASILASCGTVPGEGFGAERVAEAVRGLSGALQTSAQEKFLAAAAEVMAGVNAESAAVQALLRSVGTDLGMTEAHVRGVLASANATS